MSSVLNPQFYPVTRIISRVVLAAMLIGVLYAGWMSLANWFHIGV
jgi:hypothetical protein